MNSSAFTRFAIGSAVATIVAALGLASVEHNEAAAATACSRTTFQTQMVKQACIEGQEKAKAVMKAWNKEKNIKSCNQCHDKLAPSYSLKTDGLERYRALGGK